MRELKIQFPTSADELRSLLDRPIDERIINVGPDIRFSTLRLLSEINQDDRVLLLSQRYLHSGPENIVDAYWHKLAKTSYEKNRIILYHDGEDFEAFKPGEKEYSGFHSDLLEANLWWEAPQ